MLLPSRYINETQPLCLLEAMSVGLPVVASRIGGIPEIVGEGASAAGVCLQAPTADTLSDAVQAVHAQSEHNAAMARARYEALFSPQAFDRGLAAIMHSAQPLA